MVAACHGTEAARFPVDELLRFDAKHELRHEPFALLQQEQVWTVVVPQVELAPLGMERPLGLAPLL